MHLDLRWNTKYNALSYTTEVLGCPATMIVDDRKISIPRNLSEALTHLTPGLISGNGIAKVEYLWINTICINQQDDGERGYQVKLMRQIYEKAHQIAVWLGIPRCPAHTRHFQIMCNDHLDEGNT